MLRLSGGQVESLFDLRLPVEVRELPEDLAALDRLLESGSSASERSTSGECQRGSGVQASDSVPDS